MSIPGLTWELLLNHNSQLHLAAVNLANTALWSLFLGEFNKHTPLTFSLNNKSDKQQFFFLHLF